MKQRPAILVREGAPLRVDGRPARLSLRSVGDLIVPTGWIVACDPLVYPEQEPFTVRVPPGRYPVILSLARAEEGGPEFVAAATLRLTEAEPVRWEMALLPDDDPRSEALGLVLGYPVDAGLGCFLDASGKPGLIALLESDPDDTWLIPEIDRAGVENWTWATFSLDQETGANLICFSSGYGDGIFVSWFGYDAGGALACLVTDFGLSHESDESAAP